MLISLDTNVIILGLRKNNIFCERIIDKLDRFDIILSSVIEREVNLNIFNETAKKEFYKLFINKIEYLKIPDELIEKYKKEGLKKGDAYIAGFLDHFKVGTFISENRHFLKEIQLNFCIVMPSKEFCKNNNLI